jgi:hypothetical protein
MRTRSAQYYNTRTTNPQIVGEQHGPAGVTFEGHHHNGGPWSPASRDDEGGLACIAMIGWPRFLTLAAGGVGRSNINHFTDAE